MSRGREWQKTGCLGPERHLVVPLFTRFTTHSFTKRLPCVNASDQGEPRQKQPARISSQPTPLIRMRTAALLLLLSSSVRACSFLGIPPDGPFLGGIYTDTSLFTTDDPNVLGVYAEVYDKSFDPETFQVSINLESADVELGWPTGYDEKPTMSALSDPTQGFSVALDAFNLVATLSKDDVSIAVPLQATEGYTIVTDWLEDTSRYLMVSSSLNAAYLFYESVVNCQTGSSDERCTTCPNCSFYEINVAIVDLDSMNINYSLVDGAFELLEEYASPPIKVYDDQQIAAIGLMDSCKSQAHFSYNMTHVVSTVIFQETSLTAVRMETASYFYVEEKHTYVGNEYRYAESHIVVERSLLSGERLREIPLDQAQILEALSITPEEEAMDFSLLEAIVEAIDKLWSRLLRMLRI